MAENKIQIKKIVIQINGVELTLSLEEAKGLKKVLDELLGEKQYIPYYPYPIYYYYPSYPAPTVTYPAPTITWTTTSDNTLSSSNTYSGYNLGEYSYTV